MSEAHRASSHSHLGAQGAPPRPSLEGFAETPPAPPTSRWHSRSQLGTCDEGSNQDSQSVALGVWSSVAINVNQRPSNIQVEGYSIWHRSWQLAYASVCRFQSMLSGMLSRTLSAATSLRCSVQSARAAWRESPALSRALRCSVQSARAAWRESPALSRALFACASPPPRLLDARALVCRLPVLPAMPVRPPAWPLPSPTPAAPPTEPPL